MGISTLRPLCLAMGALASVQPLFVSAQEVQPTETALSPVVVTASRSAQRLQDALPHTTVISQEEIVRSQALDLRTLLKREAGVELTQSGGLGASTSVFMRGANSNQTLILVDGVRISSATSGNANLADLLADQIDRIEIVRGNVSALYGSDAIGGVIQIFTKSGEGRKPAPSAQVSYGTHDTRRASANYGGQVGDTAFNVGVSHLRTDGFSAINQRQVPNVNPNDNGYENTSVSASLKHTFTPDWEAGVRLFQTWSELSYDSAFGRPTDEYESRNQVRTLSAFVNGKLTDQWKTRVVLAQGNDRNRNTRNGVHDGTFNTRTRQLTWQNDYTFLPGQMLQFGTELLRQSIDTSAYTADNRRVNSVFGGYQGTFGAHQIQLNARRDKYSDFGGANSYFAGYGYAINDTFKLIANASNAFRAPTFNELFYPGFGNPDLRAERARSIEAGVQATGVLGILRVTAFRTRYQDLIINAVGPGGLFAPYNVGRAQVRGIETSYRGSVAGFDIQAGVTLQDPENRDTGAQLVRRAKRFGNLGVSRTIGPLTLGADWFVTAERKENGNRTIGGYGLLGLSASYKLTPEVSVAARVDNVFDKDHQVIYPYNTPGRTAMVTLAYRPK
ncbi:TonB-dependent receptor [Imbroritus primus]|uniref:TonB-dependent receptor n=2 Tax=Imbroritus primus TaxID=3058603 RepID=A0ACD3SL40_9BURK|nr:TonB-dependent receptor [Burkholderiaceae bacterium PBA]